VELTRESSSTAVDAIMESWDRQTRILSNISTLIGEDERKLKPSDDGWSLDHQLCHIHECRYGWLNAVDAERAKTLGDVFEERGGDYVPIADLDEIKRQLSISGRAINLAVRDHLAAGTGRIGPYEHPIYFLQHMIWHEGYHFALITLALRLAGKSPTDEWDEANVWGVWRDPEDFPGVAEAKIP